MRQVYDHEKKPAPPPLRLVQAFVNTRDPEEGTDELADAGSLVSWLSRPGLIEASAVARGADLERAVALREALRSLLVANNGGRIDPRALETLNGLSNSTPVEIAFDKSGDARLAQRHDSVGGALGYILGSVLCARADGTWGRLKACRSARCRWAFYDTSKNHAGTWCDMAVCGNRNKGRVHRKRWKTERGPRSHPG